MPDPNQTELQERLEREVARGTPARLVSFLIGLDGKERRSLNKRAGQLFSELRKADMHNHRARERSLLAMLATSTASEVAKRKAFAELATDTFDWDSENNPGPALMSFMTQVKPDWADVFVENVLGKESPSWRFAFELYQRGVCSRPGHVNFALQLPRGIRALAYEQKRPAAAIVREHASLLEPDIVRYFDLPEVDSISSYELEPYDEDQGGWLEKRGLTAADLSWKKALATLANEETISLGSMMDCSLRGLSMTQSKHLANWHAGLFELLGDADLRDSRLADIEADPNILTLLRSANSVVVNWALKRAGELQKTSRIDARDLIEQLAPAIEASSKTTAVKALKLVFRAAEKQEDCWGLACQVSIRGLLNDHPDVQTEVLKILAACGDPADESLRERLGEFADSIAASLRPQFKEWIPDELALADMLDVADETPVRHSPDVLAPERRLQPVGDVSEQIELLTFYWQNPREIRALTKALDGFARLTGGRPSDLVQRAGALLKFVDGESGGESWDLAGHQVRAVLGRLTHAWVGSKVVKVKKPLFAGKIFQPKFAKLTAVAFFGGGAPDLLSDYLAGITWKVQAGDNFELLSSPTHEGDWICPQELVARARRAEERGEATMELDACIALLRLAFENRLPALKEAVDLKGEFGMALRYALGDDGVDAGKTPSIWMAAARARRPLEDDAIMGRALKFSGPDGTATARYEIDFKQAWKESKGDHVLDHPAEIRIEPRPHPPSTLGSSQLPMSLHNVQEVDLEWSGGGDPAFVRWCYTIWPRNPDPIFAQAIRYFVRTQNEGATQHVERTQCLHLERLVGFPFPLSEVGSLLLGTGLNASQSAARALAVDALIANAELGWFDEAAVGRALSRLLGGGFARINRMLPCMKETASVGKRHGEIVARIMGHSLAVGTEEPPRQLNQWILFLVELKARHPRITLPEEARAWLETLPKKGVLGESIKKALQ